MPNARVPASTSKLSWYKNYEQVINELYLFRNLALVYIFESITLLDWSIVASTMPVAIASIKKSSNLSSVEIPSRSLAT